MSARVIRRPIGGWGARTWRREVCEWLALAALVVASWACLNLLVGAVELLAHSN